MFRQDGTIVQTWTDPQSEPTAWGPAFNLGTAGNFHTTASYAGTDPYFSIPLRNAVNGTHAESGRPQSLTISLRRLWPRRDVLQVPFIGAYRVRQVVSAASSNPAAFVEMNSITMDAVFADGEWTTPTASVGENLGRFAPLATDITGTTAVYSWAKEIFDYFTVFGPQDANTPATSAALADSTAACRSGAQFYAGSLPAGIYDRSRFRGGLWQRPTGRRRAAVFRQHALADPGHAGPHRRADQYRIPPRRRSWASSRG